MDKTAKRQFLLTHFLLLVLVLLAVLAPKARPTVRPPWSMLAGLGLIEFVYLTKHRKNLKKELPGRGIHDIMTAVWLLLIAWELTASVLNILHPVLVPAPENVFDSFREQWRQMLVNILYSLELLAAGFSVGMVLAVLAGLFTGWIPRLRDFAYPIANVLAPIPPIVFSPYLVALMPSFRSASALVIVLGVFWPTFLTTVNRVGSVEPQILDCARMLRLKDREMIFEILLPCVMPGIVSGLKVSVTTSVLMLNFAELMGAAHGMGYYIQNSITYANYTHAVAGIFCIGLVVTLLNRLVTLLQKKLIRWR